MSQILAIISILVAKYFYFTECSGLLEFPSPETQTEPPTVSIPYGLPCGITPEQDRIVGGTPTSQGEFPWLVSIQVNSGRGYRHICGGSVVNAHWIVTAAHCVYSRGPEFFQVKAGKQYLNRTEAYEQTRNVSKIIKRRDFDILFMNEDLALLKLSAPLKLDKMHVAPICLPSYKQEFAGTGLSAGWGQISENGKVSQTLLKVSMPIISKSACENSLEEYRTTSMECNICTEDLKEKRDTCMGDSGGPLMCYNGKQGRYYLCGVVSWGIGCARTGYPAVYTKVSCYTGWIAGLLTTTDL